MDSTPQAPSRADERRDQSATVKPLSEKKQTRVVVDKAASDDNSAAWLSTVKMEELGLVRGDCVLIRGKMGRKTVLVVLNDVNSKSTEAKVRLNYAVRDNLCVRLGDKVTVETCRDITPGKRIHVVPFEDSVRGLTDNLFDVYLQPYFINAYRPCHEGDTFTVHGGARSVEFKVLYTDPAEYCLVTEATMIHTGGDPVKKKHKFSTQTELGYEDLGGYRKQKAQVREMIEIPLRYPQLYQTIGVTPPRGILLLGPPGSGKTLLARIIANETGADFYSLYGPGTHTTTQDLCFDLRGLFEEAKKSSPAIIFIDELDTIISDPDLTTCSTTDRLGLVQLASLMDSLKDRWDIIVLAATSKAGFTKSALCRYGRFDHEVEFDVPDSTGRLEILRVQTKALKLCADVNLLEIAEETKGYVGADIASLCSEAALHQIHEKVHRKNLDEELIDAEFIDSLGVSMDNFRFAMRALTQKRQLSLVSGDVRTSPLCKACTASLQQTSA